MPTEEGHAMLSFRNSMGFIAVAALAVAIGMLVHAHDTSNAAAGRLWTLARPSAAHVSSPRASTYADEVANANHEGF